MSETIPNNEGIQASYEQVEGILKRLPASADRTSAEHHLELSEAAAHRAREVAAKPEAVA